MFALRFPQKDILYWSERYPAADDRLMEGVIAPIVRERGYYTKREFLTVCSWKTPRSKPRVESNPESYIQEVTRVALSTPEERLRIEVLTLLSGVSWPTASVLLHFGYDNLYPILDVRALWSLCVDSSRVTYDFAFWQQYTRFCQKLAAEAAVSMRALDRALWQYSDEHQGKLSD